MRASEVRDHPVLKKMSTQEFVNQLRASEKPEFEKFARTFFMKDLFPENGNRFKVSFEDVKNEVQGLKH